MHENTPNYNSNIHFLALGSLGGALGGSKWFFGRSRGFFGSESVGFFSKGLVLVHYKVLGGWQCQILISPIYQYTLLSRNWFFW